MEFINHNGKKYPIVYRNTPTDPIDCPYCGRKHTHGTSEGHRIAHCSTEAMKRTVWLDDGDEVDYTHGYHIKIGS